MQFKVTKKGETHTLILEDLGLDDGGKISCKAGNVEGEVCCSSNLLVRKSRKTSENQEGLK